MGIITLQNRHLFECSLEDREGLFEEVKLILALANKHKIDAVFGLENELDISITDYFLKWGIILVIDGTDPEILRQVMENVIICSDKTGVELLRRIVQMEGIICIQRGLNPRLIKEMLMGFLGEDVLFGEKAMLF